MQASHRPRLAKLGTVLTLGLISGSAQAQFGDRHSITDTSTSTCTVTEAGRFFGRAGMDVVQLFNGAPTAFKLPELYRARVNIQATGNDLAVLPGTGIGDDRILVVGPAGLTRWSWNGIAFNDDSRNTVGGPWMNATAIGVGDFDGNGELDIYGIDATRTKLLLCRPVERVWENTITIPFGETVYALEPIQWDGVGAQELAVRTADQLKIVDLTMTVVATRSVLGTRSDLEIVDLPGSTYQTAVCLEIDTNGAPWLKVFANGTADQTVDLVGFDVAAITAGYIDAGSTPDLVLSHDGATLELFGGTVTAGVLTFAQDLIETAIPVTDWSPSGSHASPPTLADFDGDGDEDVLFAPPGADRVDLYANRTIDGGLLQAEVTQAGMTTDAADEGVFNLMIVMPQLDTSWTDIEVTAWRQPSFDCDISSVAHEASTYTPIPSSGPVNLAIPIATGFSVPFADLYFLQVHVVERSGGTVIRQGPASVGLVGLSAAILSHLDQHGEPLNSFFGFASPSSAFLQMDWIFLPCSPTGSGDPEGSGSGNAVQLPTDGGGALGGGGTGGGIHWPDSDDDDPPKP